MKLGSKLEIVNRKTYDASHPERPTVISYFTVDTPYEAEAEVLKLSLESVGYSYIVCGVKGLGSWQKNTQLKAHFILTMLEEQPGQPLLYLDVDAIMVQPPTLLDDLKADIAAVHFRKRSEFLSGTIFLGNTPICRHIVKEWIKINEQFPETLPNGKLAWDQRTLKMAIDKTEAVDYVELPQEYTWITELTQKYAPELSPVIMHTRGAKRFKNKIDGKEGYAK